MLMVGRRYTQADSVIDRIESQYPETSRVEAADLRSLLAREYGRPGEANRVIDSLVAIAPSAAWFIDVIRADNRRLQGDYAGAARVYESISHVGPAPVR